MQLEPWFPKDLELALHNKPSEEEVTQLLKQTSSPPRFVYGVLMLPTVLKYIIDMDHQTRMDKFMIHGTLAGYQLQQFADSSPPVITRSSNPAALVEGFLVFNLNESQRSALFDFESGLMRLDTVQVTIQEKINEQLNSLRIIEASAFVWLEPQGQLTPIRSTWWNIGDFVKSSFYRNMLDSQYRRATLPPGEWRFVELDLGEIRDDLERGLENDPLSDSISDSA